MKIVQFANFMVTNNSSEEGSDFAVLTYLTGDNLDDRKKQQQSANSTINHAGILQSIPVKYEQVGRFYSKSKKKWSNWRVLDSTFGEKSSINNVLLGFARGHLVRNVHGNTRNQGKFLS